MLDHPLKIDTLGQKSLGVLAIHPLPQGQDDGAGRAQQQHPGAKRQRPQPLSQLIRALEKSLDAQLFVCTTRSVILTASGELLLERAGHILAAVADAIVDVHRADRGEIGSVRLGFTDLCVVDVLPRLAQAFQRRHPTVHLDVRGSYNSYEEVDLLLAGDLDAGIIYGNVVHPGLAL